MTRGLKFRIKVGEGLYYPCSEIKDADQLRGYREADLRLCFRICKNPVFSWRGSYECSIRSMWIVYSKCKCVMDNGFVRKFLHMTIGITLRKKAITCSVKAYRITYKLTSLGHVCDEHG